MFHYQQLATKAERVFMRHDRDKDGLLETAELLTSLRELGLDPSEAYVRAILDRYDSDANRRLDMKEFTLLVQDVQSYQETATRASLLFRAQDKNRSGTIERCELGPTLRALGIDADAEKIAEILARYDHDGNDRLDMREFLTLVKEVREFQSAAHRPRVGPRAVSAAVVARREPADEVERMFTKFDRDGDGEISQHELIAALEGLGLNASREQAVTIFERFDQDGNGSIDLIEWRQLVNEVRAFQDQAGVESGN